MFPPVLAPVVAAAARAAGGWLLSKGKQLLDIADNAARTVSRRVLAENLDALSGPVAGASRGYQEAKATVVEAAEKVSSVIDKIKQLFGMEPPQSPAKTCPLKALALPPDGSILVPSDTCPSDYVAVPPAASRQGSEFKDALAQAKAKSPPSRSKTDCCADKPESARNKTTVYVNGINNNAKAHCETLIILRDMTCGKVIGVFNNTEGMATDLIRSADARDMIRSEIGKGPARTYPGFSPAVQTLQDLIVAETANGAPLEIVAHSEGGAITSLAAIRAKKALSDANLPNAIDNLNVTSLGSAAPLWPEGPSYKHYLHVNDPVPNFFGLGDAAKGENIVRFGGRESGFSTEGEKGFKKPYVPTSFDDHSADKSYLAYIKEKGGGCL